MSSKIETGKHREHVSEFQLQWKGKRAKVGKGGRENGNNNGC